MSAYAYGDQCPVCGRDIKRRPAELAGRPCADCGQKYVSPRDIYRLRNARLTDASILEIITAARARHDAARTADAAGTSASPALRAQRAERSGRRSHVADRPGHETGNPHTR